MLVPSVSVATGLLSRDYGLRFQTRSYWSNLQFEALFECLKNCELSSAGSTKRGSDMCLVTCTRVSVYGSTAIFFVTRTTALYGAWILFNVPRCASYC